MTGETKTSTSHCKLRKGLDGIRSYDAHRIDCSTRIMDTMCFFKDFFISLRYFNQLDATSKVIYRHEINCTGNTAQFNSQLFVCKQCSGCLVLKKFVNKANSYIIPGSAFLAMDSDILAVSDLSFASRLSHSFYKEFTDSRRKELIVFYFAQYVKKQHYGQ